MSRARVTTGAARAVARLAKQVEVALGPLDLSLPQYRVLALLGDGSTASSVLARKLAVSPPTVTAVVDGLVARGLVERQADPEDRRRLTLLLTRDGKRAARRRRRRGRDAPRRDRGVPRRAARRARRRTRQLEPRPRPQPRGAREARLVTIEMGAFGADVTSPFVPVGVTPRYPPPRAHIKPDRGGSWLRRIMPIVLAHKWMFGFSLLASFLGLAVQVQIPNEVGQAIDALGKTDGPVARALRGHHRGARGDPVRAHVHCRGNYLLKTAYRIEYDLRNIMYEHLSRMSFSFYDRVQSGQLISRANSDIRSVQMYLAFAPSILVQCSVAVLAFAEMLVDQRPARVRHDVDDAVRLHRRRADAEADVPGVVAHPVTARRRRHRRRREHQRRARRQVVRGRGRAAPAPHRRGDARGVGERQGRRHPGQVVAAAREPAPARAGHRAVLRRLPRHQRAGDGRRHRRVQRLRADAAAAVPPARHDPDDGPAGRRRRRSASTRCSTSSPTSSIARARSTSSSAAATCTSTT